MIEILYWCARGVSWLLSLYMFVLFIRVILSWATFFVSPARMPGPVAFVGNIVYALTDPPLRVLRRYIPPARIGAVALDVAFMVLLFAVMIASRLVWVLYALLVRLLVA